MRVLITRPVESAADTCAALAKAGHETLSSPLFSVVPIQHAISGSFDAVLATSGHAPRLLADDTSQGIKLLPFYAVGDATAAAARTAGFATVHSARGDGEALAALLKNHTANGSRLLYLAGVPRRDTAIQTLAADFQLTTIEVYQTLPVASLDTKIVAALKQGKLDAVMHFSPRAAEVFLNLAEKAGVQMHIQNVLHVCISTATQDKRMIRTSVAQHPTLEGMIAALTAEIN
ncbi:MAG: uroporphyrinogen-III synthase [Beijerinckiaceae bacterium]